MFHQTVLRPVFIIRRYINPLNAKLNPICHLLALLGAHLIFHVSRIRVKCVRTLWDPILFTLIKAKIIPNFSNFNSTQHNLI